MRPIPVTAAGASRVSLGSTLHVVRFGMAGQMHRIGCVLAFLCLVVPLGIILATVTPIGDVPDELAHGFRAESLADGEILAHRQAVTLPDGSTHISAGVNANLGLSGAVMISNTTGHASPEAIRATRFATWRAAPGYAELTPLAVYMPVFYAPGAIAIRAARHFALAPLGAFMVLRFTNLASFAAIGAAALLLARRGQTLLLCVLGLPMEVSLAASPNQDGQIVAVAVLAAALLTRTEADRGAGSSDDWRPTTSWLAAALLIMAISLAKVPYLGLLALLLLPVPRFDRGLARRFGYAALFALPPLIWTAYAMHAIAEPWPPMPPYSPGPLWKGPPGTLFASPDAAAQLQVLLAKPARIITLTLDTLGSDPWVALQTVGILGLLDIVLPLHAYLFWFVAAGLACVAEMSGGREKIPASWSVPGALVVVLGVCGCIIGVYMSQYLTWTKVGATEVFGPSGRYLLPLLPCAVFLLPRVPWRWGGGARLALSLPLLVPLAVDLVLVPLAIVEANYL